jgi:hypothetical protein
MRLLLAISSVLRPPATSGRPVAYVGALQARLHSKHNRKRCACGGVAAPRCTWCGDIFEKAVRLWLWRECIVHCTCMYAGGALMSLQAHSSCSYWRTWAWSSVPPGAPVVLQVRLGGAPPLATGRRTCGLLDAVAGPLQAHFQPARQARHWDSGANFVRAGAAGTHICGGGRRIWAWAWVPVLNAGSICFPLGYLV